MASEPQSKHKIPTTEELLHALHRDNIDPNTPLRAHDVVQVLASLLTRVRELN